MISSGSKKMKELILFDIETRMTNNILWYYGALLLFLMRLLLWALAWLDGRSMTWVMMISSRHQCILAMQCNGILLFKTIFLHLVSYNCL